MSSVTDTAESFRAGIIGTGFLGMAMGREFRRHDRGTVGALTDVSSETLTRAARELGVSEESQYLEYERMIDEEELDCLVITTPHSLHHEQLVAGLEHGLHVICEKPLCTDLDDARDIVRRVEKSDRTVMLGYQRHLDTAFRTAREYWHADEAEPAFITGEVTQDWIGGVEGSWKANPDLSGGGQLYDTGSHLVDAVLWTTGLTPTSVTAQMAFHDDAERVDTQAMVSVKFENDAVATISVSGDAPRVAEGLHIWGEQGATLVEGHEWNPRQYKEIDRDGNITAPNINWGSERSKTEAFIEAIDNDTEPPATVYDGLRSTAVTEAAYEAAWTGKRVDIDLDR